MDSRAESVGPVVAASSIVASDAVVVGAVAPVAVAQGVVVLGVGALGAVALGAAALGVVALGVVALDAVVLAVVVARDGAAPLGAAIPFGVVVLVDAAVLAVGVVALAVVDTRTSGGEGTDLAPASLLHHDDGLRPWRDPWEVLCSQKTVADGERGVPLVFLVKVGFDKRHHKLAPDKAAYVDVAEEEGFELVEGASQHQDDLLLLLAQVSDLHPQTRQSVLRPQCDGGADWMEVLVVVATVELVELAVVLRERVAVLARSWAQEMVLVASLL